MKKFSFILIMLVSVVSAFAQNILIGVVTDSLTGKPLISANVYFKNTVLGAATDIDGLYRIEGVSDGSYTLVVSYLGYKTREYPLKLTGGVKRTFNANLVYQIIEGEAVVITAQAEGQSAAINQQIRSNTIINVVSEEKIKELPDANAAESIGRLPGVSITRSGGEANKILLRGMSDKYTTIMIDGVKIPPTDATSRGVDLSTLSQSSLAGIELYKAITPDKDGDALAGAINLVTKKAPEKRLLKADIKGDYNHLEKSFNQYQFALHYGERFFSNMLGVQLTGNLEKRIRSNERINVNYNQTLSGGNDYTINDFILEYTDEIRNRDGVGLLLDFNTPDDGNIRFNNVFGKTKRDYLWSYRDYPIYGGGNQQGNPSYEYRDREQEISTFNSSLHGTNYLAGINLNWGLSFAQSLSDYPFDYDALFVEPSGMNVPPSIIRNNPEQLISYAVNNFSSAGLNSAYARTQRNFDKERTAMLDILKSFAFTPSISVEFKMGGKYKIKDRTNNRSEAYSPYYLGKWKTHELLPDGTLRQKDFTGTYFEEFWRNTLENPTALFVQIDEFFKEAPGSRDVYDKYTLNPLIDKNRLRQWYFLNRYGIDGTGNEKEAWVNPLIEYDDYNITERVAAGYLMQTINLWQKLTLIAGLRIENEDNDYLAKYMPKMVSGFPVPANSLKDTTSSNTQNVLLPNFQIAFRPFSFMNLRMAAFKALTRPDFNMRLDRYIAGRPAEVGTNFEVSVGNPKLKTAQAWNYEINTSFFGKSFGLISLSAYYKEIKDMYHMLNDFNTTGDSILAYFDIQWASQMKTTPYFLTLPYNSPKLTKVWGFEFEHQTQLSFLPGILKNIVLSYNASIVRSETFMWTSKIDSTYYDPPGPIPPTWKYFTKLAGTTQKLEGMPDYFGNIALGYDIGGFSARLSLFHQGEYYSNRSANRLSDQVSLAFTKLDLAVKQRITDHASVIFNINNVTNVEEGNDIINWQFDRRLFDQSEKYGLTADFGVVLEL